MKKASVIILKIISTAVALFASYYALFVTAMLLFSSGINHIITYIGLIVVPSLLLPLIWLKKRKKFLIIWCICAAVYGAALGTNFGIIRYNKSITVNTSPNIDIQAYLPFDEDSKIVKTDSKTLKLTENLPRIDGAAALFPVYSAFVNAVYPNTTKLHDGIFEYNNTPDGYRLLAEKETDIFIGVYPSDEQRAYAEENQTTFEYTPIGTEAFVDAVKDAVKKNDKVQLVGFGTFESRKREAREGKNPQTGEKIKIAACNSPAFKPGKGFKDYIN